MSLQLSIIIISVMKKRLIFFKLKISVLTSNLVLKLFIIFTFLYKCAAANLLFKEFVNYKFKLIYLCVISDSAILFSQINLKILIYIVVVI